MQEQTEAVVLRGIDYGETSRIITFLTPDRGRMACMVKGVRRKGSPFAAILATFNRVELLYLWKEGRTVQQVTDASLLDAYTPVKSDLERSVYAAFVLEVAYKAAHENDPSASLYETLVDGLAGFSEWTGSPMTYACWQVMRLLSAAGYALSLDSCVRCGQELAAAQATVFTFDGGMVCPECRGDVRLTPESVESLRAMAAADQCPDLTGSPNLLRLIARYAAHQLDTRFRSVDVIAQMFMQ